MKWHRDAVSAVKGVIRGKSHINENSLMLRGSVGAAKTLCPQSLSPSPSLRAHNQFTPFLALAKGAEHLQEGKLASNSKMPVGRSWRWMPAASLGGAAPLPSALSPLP